MDSSTKINFLLIRGLGREARHWGEFSEKLKNSEFSGEVNFVDLPGVGTEYKRSSLWSFDEAIEDLRARVNLSENTVLCSISFGSMVGLKWMEKYPEDFLGFIGINTSDRRLSSPFKRLKPKALMALLKVFFTQDLVSREEKVYAITSRRSNFSGRNSAISRWVEIAEQNPVNRMTFLSQMYLAGKFSAPQLKENKSMLFLASEKDEMVDYSCSQRLAEFYQARCFVNKDAGHDLPLDSPVWLVEKIGEFIRSCYF